MSIVSRLRSRSTRLVAAAAVLPLAVAAVAPADAATLAQTKNKAAAYQMIEHLAAQGQHLTSSNGQYVDYGSTIDAALSLDAAHVGQRQATRTTNYVANHINEYIGSGGERYAGALGKALLLSRAQNVQPAGTLGGVNLKQELINREQPNGRFTDQSSWGDYSNTFSQSFALVGLRRAGVAPSAKSIDYLYLQQCPGGGFRQDEADTQCSDPASATVDATSIAVQALKAVPSTTESASRMGQAIGYLKTQQRSDGGFSGGAVGVNSNTTGLAALALQTGGAGDPARRARGWLIAHSYGCKAPRAYRGLIAYNQASYTGTGRTMEQELKSTSQAMQGLAQVPYVSITKNNAALYGVRNPC